MLSTPGGLVPGALSVCGGGRHAGAAAAGGHHCAGCSENVKRYELSLGWVWGRGWEWAVGWLVA